ncbi:hypothetical protein B0H14DRAFT_3443014 [Mycena olivaceomarginata]|nr:hypothetical protein B0H14DRAFT_3443014 [Mycena olivaceomarginata]
MQLKAPFVDSSNRTSFTTNPNAARSASSSASANPLTAADLRIISPLARSSMHNLSCHADNPNSWLSDLEQQNLVLCERLQTLLALYGRHLRADVDGEGDNATSLPLSKPAPPAPLRFITTTRVLSASRGSTGNNGKALEMPALLVTLLLHRRECKDETGAGTRTFQYTAHMRSGERRSRVRVYESLRLSIPRELRVNPVHPRVALLAGIDPPGPASSHLRISSRPASKVRPAFLAEDTSVARHFDEPTVSLV